jgi:hypothetical protein
VVRGDCHFSIGKRYTVLQANTVNASTGFKHRTGGMRCQTLVSPMSRTRRISQARCNALQHPRNAEMENAGEKIAELFFRSSTDREAKELLFLERFTFFQQA